MNRLQLATLLNWADETGFEGRKRLQKVIYLLQQAGCPLSSDYVLHHYGPYSRDVADLCDEMVAAGLIEERGGPSESSPYAYRLQPKTRELLHERSDDAMQPFESLARELIAGPLWHLELGSTILLFRRRGLAWEQARSSACEFKRVQPDDPASLASLELARQIAQHAGAEAA